MPIDPLNDRLLTLKEAIDLFPRRRRGTKLNIATLWRWMNSGSRGVVLETVRVGNQNYTTELAIREFIAAHGRPAATTMPSPSAATSKAMKRLSELGL